MKTKVLLISPVPGNNYAGGIARWTTHIMSYYNAKKDKEGIELSLLPVVRTLKAVDESSFNRLRKGIPDYLSIILEFRKRIRRQRPDVVHLVSSGSVSLIKDYIILKLAHNKGIKTVVHFRYGRIPEISRADNMEWKLLKRVAGLADKTILLDVKSYNTLHEAGFENIEILPNPLSEDITRLAEQYRAEGRRERTLLFVGQLVPAKGINELMAACLHIPGIKLRLAGSVAGDVKERLMEQAAAKDEPGWLEILGEREYPAGIIKEMASASVFVLPTYTEGFPNVILESMACGCPIVASAVGAIPEMLDGSSGKPAGLVIPPKDPAALEGAIRRMLDDKGFAAACGENAHGRVSEQYSMNSVWYKMARIWAS